MLRKLHKKSSMIAGVFTLGLFSALLCDYLCDIGVVEFGGALHQHDTSVVDGNDHGQPPQADNHSHFFDFLFASHEHNESHDSRSSHDHSAGHEHSHDEDDACCEDEMENLFLGLFKQASPDFDFVQTFVFINAFFYQYLSNDTVDHQINFSYDDPSRPPGPGIRVLIQSFLN